MNWIKLTPESQLPEKQEVLVRVQSEPLNLYFYQIGFVTDQAIHLENEEMEADITHYCLIEEPADIAPVLKVASDNNDFPFS